MLTMSDNNKNAQQQSVTQTTLPGHLRRCVPILLASLLLSGCVTTAVGAVVGTTLAVGTAVVKVPIKATKAVVGAVTKDKDDTEQGTETQK